MKSKILALVSLFLYFSLSSLAQGDADLNKKIETLEVKISKVKTEMPEADKKKNFAGLSDVENRKNNLKSMLNTPVDKRDNEWKQKWDLNYNKAIEKVEKMQIK